MHSEITGNQNYDDHYANDGEDVHSALLPAPCWWRTVYSKAPCTITYS
jgi:hypothetical protein